MRKTFVARAHALTHRVVSGPGELDPSIRQAAAAGAPIHGPAGAYAEKVRRHAFKVIDDDVAALHAAGFSDAQIFELTEASAYGAALTRLDAALAALAEGGR